MTKKIQFVVSALPIGFHFVHAEIFEFLKDENSPLELTGMYERIKGNIGINIINKIEVSHRYATKIVLG